MNDQQLITAVHVAMAKAPKAERIPQRTELDFVVDDSCMRMQADDTPAGKLKWARRMNAARRARGDFDHITDAKREKLDPVGERHD